MEIILQKHARDFPISIILQIDSTPRVPERFNKVVTRHLLFKQKSNRKQRRVGKQTEIFLLQGSNKNYIIKFSIEEEARGKQAYLR